jgi:hypothetical protein
LLTPDGGLATVGANVPGEAVVNGERRKLGEQVRSAAYTAACLLNSPAIWSRSGMNGPLTTLRLELL